MPRWGETAIVEGKGWGIARVKITDQKSFEAWLKTRPAADDDIRAARIGLRVFPLWGRRMVWPWAIRKNLSALPILRMLLLKSIAQGDKAGYNRTQARAAAAADASNAYAANANAKANAAAANAANAAANAAAAAAAAASAANAAAYTANAASYAGAQRIFWAAVSVDANALQIGQDSSQLPLWADTPPNWFSLAIRVC